MRYPVTGPHGGAPWRIRPELTKPSDGDSFWATVDRGDGDTSLWHIRLLDVFAPETHDPGGPECAALLREWLRDHGDGSEWPYLLETYRTPRSDADVKTLSRWVGLVSSAAPGDLTLNGYLRFRIIEQGWGHGIGAPT